MCRRKLRPFLFSPVPSYCNFSPPFSLSFFFPSATSACSKCFYKGKTPPLFPLPIRERLKSFAEGPRVLPPSPLSVITFQVGLGYMRSSPPSFSSPTAHEDGRKIRTGLASFFLLFMAVPGPRRPKNACVFFFPPLLFSPPPQDTL